jgi:hypothetical protein
VTVVALEQVERSEKERDSAMSLSSESSGTDPRISVRLRASLFICLYGTRPAVTSFLVNSSPFLYAYWAMFFGSARSLHLLGPAVFVVQRGQVYSYSSVRLT